MVRHPIAGVALTSFVTSAVPVTSTKLHTRTRETLDRVRAGQCVPVTHYNAVEGYLVPPEQMEDMTARLSQAEHREQELRDTLPLVLGAVRAGVAIPSEALDRLAPGLDDSWQAIAEFAATFPVWLSRGENGEPITRGRLRSFAGPVEESGDDDELNLDA